MKIYRRHRCTSQHRTARTFVKCSIRRLEWVHGTGQIALIAWCRTPTVTLHDDAANALDTKRMIDGCGCGGQCLGRHDIVLIDLDRQEGSHDRQL